MLHVPHAVQCGHYEILIHTLHTDVVVLSADVQLWLAFRNGQIFRYLDANVLKMQHTPIILYINRT